MEKYLESKKCEICWEKSYNILYKWNKWFYNHKKYETCSWDWRENIDLQFILQI